MSVYLSSSKRRGKRRRRNPTIMVGSVIASVACLALAGCGSSSNSSTGTSAPAPAATGQTAAATGGSAAALLPASVKGSGTLSDYINIPYEPMEFYLPGTHTPTGLDVDLAEALAADMGMKVKFTNVLFPDLFTSLESGRAQFVISGAYDAPSRRGTYEFIDYFKTGTPFFSTKQNIQKYGLTSVSALCGKTVATVSGTDYIQELQDLGKRYCGSAGSIHTVLSNAPATDELNVVDGRAVDVFDQGIEAVQYFLDHQKGVTDSGNWQMLEQGKTYYPTDYGLILTKGSPLEPAFTAAMRDIIANGTYQRILAKWNLSAGALSAPTLNAGPPIP